MKPVMNPIQASCPSCGAPVAFKVGSSLVAVCEYCRSIVGRGDKKLEDLGKVADVTDSGSPLDLWLKGRFEGVPFDLTGRVQYSHPAGGFWDEWYAHFADDRWGWLAEAMGRFFMTFQQPTQLDLPAFDELQLGQKVEIGPDRAELLVAEKNRAKAIGARGEIPFRLEPNADHPFADLSGPESAFGTLDYSEVPPLVFLGREVTLDDLGIPKSVKPGQREARQVSAVSLNCPQCGSALTLRAPDKTERVGCPSCGSLLDVKDGQLELLQSLHPPRVQPVIPLGASGELQGTRYTVLGFMQRSVTIEGTTYYWHEYLLYEPRAGFRWLVLSDGHWNFVEPLPPGEVEMRHGTAQYGTREYKLFQRAVAKVEFVIGEFYWKVQAGELVLGQDYIAPPEMLSQEITKDGDQGEINWSHGVYLQPQAVAKAFGLPGLPPPEGVGPNQPFPYAPVYKQFAWLVAASFLLIVAVLLLSPGKTILSKNYHLQPLAKGMTSSRIIDEEPLQLAGHRNVKVSLRVPSTVSWVFVEGELTPKDSPKRIAFTLLGEPGKDRRVFLSAPPAGEYGLDLKFQWPNPNAPADAQLIVEQGVAHPLPFFTLLLALAVVPFGVGLYHAAFEAQRWSNSSLDEAESPAVQQARLAVPIGRKGKRQHGRAETRDQSGGGAV